MKFHFIGIGGSGMSVVAEILAKQGHTVSGSDRKSTPTLEYIQDLGAQVYLGHDASQVDPEAILVVSSAVRTDNPEYECAYKRGQRIWHRSVALRFAALEQDFVAVAGTHGKTTTTALIATALSALGADPSFAVGGKVTQFGTGAHVGAGKIFIAEADESDGSFLNYRPRAIIVTNQEPDHLDHHGTKENLERAFLNFVHNLGKDGVLICNSDDPGSRGIALQAIRDGIAVATYGRAAGPFNSEITAGTSYGKVIDKSVDMIMHQQDEQARGNRVSPMIGRNDKIFDRQNQLLKYASAEEQPSSEERLNPDSTIKFVNYLGHLQVDNVCVWKTGTDIEDQMTQNPDDQVGKAFLPSGWTGTPVLSIPGMHNMDNAAGALLVAAALGFDANKVCASFAAYQGTKRRFELRGTVSSVRVYDDYAHHPTEIKAAIAMARTAVNEGGRLVVLFQPHLYTRTRNFSKEFAQSLQGADVVVVSGVCGAREDPIAGVEGNLITEKMQTLSSPSEAPVGMPYVEFVQDRIGSAKRTADLARPNDLIMTMGCGDVNELCPVILEQLQENSSICSPMQKSEQSKGQEEI